MRVIHLQRADAHQAEEFAGFFITVACPIFRETNRQVAIGAPFEPKILWCIGQFIGLT